MTRDVLIRLSGLQSMEDDEGVVEVITAGDYFWKNNKHYLIYDEVMEGTDGTIRNTMKLTPDKLEIRKSGPISASMVFEVDKKTQTHYATPMGEMLVEMTASRIGTVCMAYVFPRYQLRPCIRLPHCPGCDIQGLCEAGAWGSVKKKKRQAPGAYLFFWRS